jgi:RNA polymerase sigma factor (sigma-70 family)
MELLQFLREVEPIAERNVNWMSWRLAKARQAVNKDDLQQEVIVKLIVLHKENEVDFGNDGWKNFCDIKIKGWLKNYVKKQRGEFDRYLKEADIPSQEDDARHSIEDMAFCYTEVDAASQTEQQIRRLLIQTIGEYLNSISDEDRFIFNSYYIDGKSFGDIGRVLGFSRETARRRAVAVKQGLVEFSEFRGWTQTDITELS